MPIKTDLNVSPYFNDYDETKNYHQILFRPSTAVQARELTQLQSILQNQIERFGSWAFKSGDIVEGCAINDIPLLPYVRLQDSQVNSSNYDVLTLVNTQVICATSNLMARVLYANNGFSKNYPETNIVYLQYMNTGTGGEQYFSNTDQLTFYSIPRTGNDAVDIQATVSVYPNSSLGTYSTGNAHGISVSEGVVFLNGNFIKINNPTLGLVNNYGTDAGNNVVGFLLNETIVTENQDPSLGDNALGYSNENAPGAHRLKLEGSLISLDQIAASNTDGFNPIAIYNYGALVSRSSATSDVYSVIGNAIATRTYDESGNYVVNPFVIDTITNTINDSLPTLSSNTIYARVSPGKGYAQGYRIENDKTLYVNMRRGTDTQVNKSQQITFNYGGYYIVNEVAGVFPFEKAQTVQLYDTTQKTITNRTFSSIVSPSGNNIGTAQLRCFSYNNGTPGTNSAQYNLHLFNVQMSNGYNVNQVRSVYYNGTTKGIADVYSNGMIGSARNSQLYSFGLSGVKNLRDSSNNNNTQYVYRTEQTGSMYSNGVVVVTLGASSTGGVDILPYGVGLLAPLDVATINLIATANVDSTALTGTVAVSSTNATVNGTSTSFTSQFLAGDQIKVGTDIRTIVTIANNTSLTVDSNFGSTLTGQSYYKSYLKGKIVPLATSLNTSYVNITNSTSFTINSGLTLQSSMGINVTYDVLRTGATPAKKMIKKNRFVRVNTAVNPYGPWCLGYSDISKISKIYAGASTYSTSGSDVTNQFSYDTGQRDTHYDLGYLYSKGGFNQSATPCLLVQLDYYATNTAPGTGFYTIESYPVQDDVTLANANTVYTKDIPLYVTASGAKNYLRDYVDFRVPCTITATDTGDIDTSNATQVTTAISLSTLNPSNTLTLSVPATGLNVPSYGRNLQADYTLYLPRKDLIYVTPENTFKVKEGTSSLNPQTPLFPDNGMALTVLNIPPFPSLTSDQVLDNQVMNQNYKNLIRDTSTNITSSLVTNRGYKMSDIGKLDQRITNLEYYTSLSLLQQQATALTVTDANGLNRFKNGIFVDPFNDFSYSEVSNPEYSIAIDGSKGIARPKFAAEAVYLKFDSSSSTNAQKTGRCITLPYTETSFLRQPFATKYRSAALVASAWNGSMILIPSYDNIDYVTGNTIPITINNAQPWQDFANSPFGSIWGPWQTTRSTTVESVTTGTANRFDLVLKQNTTNQSSAAAQAQLDAAIASYQAQGYQIGSSSLIYRGSDPRYKADNSWTGGTTTQEGNTQLNSDTSRTIITNLGSTPNYTNVGAGTPIFQ